MKRSNSSSFYKTGRLLGKPFSWLLRKEAPLIHLLAKKGLSYRAAKHLMHLLNLVAVALIFLPCIPLWIMIFVVFILLAVYLDIDLSAPSTPASELSEGWDGHGLYDNQLDIRIDGGHFDDNT